MKLGDNWGYRLFFSSERKVYFGKRNSYFKMYDPEANKYGGADYSQFDNTMAFSDSSIRAGKGYTCNF